jgi:L-threonylcarbamoyladenylate synthase
MALVLKVDPDRPDDAPLVRAANVLKSGGVVVYPTETLYGLGALATDAEAIERIHVLKRRESGKPILVLAATKDDAVRLVTRVSPAAELLMSAFWPGPLTLVLPVAESFPDVLTQGRRTLGVRVPSSTLCLRLLALTGVPITSTSTNLSKGPVLRSIPAIREVFDSGVDLYLDAGTLPDRAPSTVVDVSGDLPRLIRAGTIPLQALQRVTIVEE